MEINFSDTDIIFIYGHFRKEARKLEELKAMPNCPFTKSNINKNIKIFLSIADKIKDACPNLAKMDKFKI